MNAINENKASQTEAETLVVDLPVQEAQPAVLNSRGSTACTSPLARLGPSLRRWLPAGLSTTWLRDGQFFWGQPGTEPPRLNAALFSQHNWLTVGLLVATTANLFVVPIGLVFVPIRIQQVGLGPVELGYFYAALCPQAS